MASEIYFRTDASPGIGTGHVLRCYYLASEMKKRGWKPVFLCKNIPDTLKDKLEENRIEVRVFSESLTEEELVNSLKKNEGVLVTDGDQDEIYTESYQSYVKGKGLKLVMITFRNDCKFLADIVHNQNVLAFEQEYMISPYTMLLLGPEYVILNDSVMEAQKNVQTFSEKPYKFLITFGGADKIDRTSRIYKALQSIKPAPESIVVIAGTYYPERKKLAQMVEESSINTEVFTFTEDLPVIMASSKYAFTSGGLTAWELGVLNVCNCIIGNTEREVRSAEILKRKGYCHYFGKSSEINEEKLPYRIQNIIDDENGNLKMVNSLHKQVSGNGTDKVADKISRLIYDEL